MTIEMFDHLTETETQNLGAAQLTDWINACYDHLEADARPFLVYETPFCEHILAFDARRRYASLLIASENLTTEMILEIATRLLDSQGYWYHDCDENRYTLTVGTNFDVDESLPIFELNSRLADTMRLTTDFTDTPSRYLSIQIDAEE